MHTIRMDAGEYCNTKKRKINDSLLHPCFKFLMQVFHVEKDLGRLTG